MKASLLKELQVSFSNLLATVPESETEVVAFLLQMADDWQNQGSDFLLDLKNSLRYGDALSRVLKAINSEIGIEEMLSLILDTAIELTDAERGFILLRDLEVARHFDGENIVGEYKISRTMASNVKRTGHSLITDDAQCDQRFICYDSVRKYRARSILCIPIAIKGRTLGVVYLDNRLVKGKFHKSHLRQMTIFAEQTAIALENARLCRELSRHSQKIKLLNVKLQRKHKKTDKTDSLQCFSGSQNSGRYRDLYGRSAKMQEVFAIIEKIKDCDIPVLIQGESGTGKELVAHATHCAGSFHDKPFICENCAAIPEALFESELFGHEKGAFTNASRMKQGLFEKADGGTLFLDEIGELSMEVQKKLLRVLAEKCVRRVGGDLPIPVRVRIITATNRNLREMIERGEFREDLFYRLNGISIELPPLRERKEDIPMLIEHFLEEIDNSQAKRKIGRSLLSVLVSYRWPGNVRQLRNEIQRLVALSGPVLEARYLSPEILPHDSPKTDGKIRNLPELLHEVEKAEIIKTLVYCNYKKTRTAALLGISRFTLQRKMEKYGLQ